MRSRPLLLVLLAIALVGLGLLARGIPVTRSVAAEDPAAAGAGVTPSPSASGSIWFCPTGSAGTATPPTHRIQIANSTARTISGSLVSWTTAGKAGSPSPVSVGPNSTLEADAGPGSTMVELTSSGATVSHELVGSGVWDEGPCSSQPSDQAYFPSIDTRRGNSAQLTLFNPFEADTIVDVTVSTDDSVRVPNQLASLVIPGGTSKTIELNSIVERRATFSAAVRARSGRFVAELAQVDDGQPSPEDNSQSPKGLRLQLGVPELSRHQIFADGLVTAGVTEALVIANPTNVPAKVAVSVLPFDADPAARPQPFVVDVAPSRSTTLQLDQEARIPPDTPHWVRVDVVEGSGVVAERVATVTAANSLDLDGGVASSVGSPRIATRWVVSSLDPAEKTTEVLAIANPSVHATAKVQISTFAGGAQAAAAASATVQIGPGKGAAIDLAPIVAASPGGAVMGLVVTSDHPIAIERRGISSAKHDVSITPASPVTGTLSPLPPLAAQIKADGS